MTISLDLFPNPTVLSPLATLRLSLTFIGLRLWRLITFGFLEKRPF